MITLAEINRLCETHGVPPETIEKDYMISWILASLSRSPLAQDFSFYGGTAIKRVYFLDHRYSEDIDLISTKQRDGHILSQQLSGSFRLAQEEAGLDFGIDSRRILTKGARTQIFISYSGFDEIAGSPKEIRIDFALEREAYGEKEEKKLHETYSDLKGLPVKLWTHSLNTILADKLGLLVSSTRKEPRDLYDVWFLLQRTSQFDFNLQKLKKCFDKKYGFPATLGVLRPPLQNRLYRERWETRLAKQLVHLPTIDLVIREIDAKLVGLFAPLTM